MLELLSVLNEYFDTNNLKDIISFLLNTLHLSFEDIKDDTIALTILNLLGDTINYCYTLRVNEQDEELNKIVSIALSLNALVNNSLFDFKKEYKRFEYYSQRCQSQFKRLIELAEYLKEKGYNPKIFTIQYPQYKSLEKYSF